MEQPTSASGARRAVSALHWAPIRFAVARPLRKSPSLRSIAVEERLIAPRAERIVPPAFFEPSDLERVKGVQSDTTVERERRRVMGGTVRHGATIVYKVPKALLCGSHVYAGSTRMRIGEGRVFAYRPWRIAPTVPRGMMCGSLYASTYFGHWVTDQLTTELLAEDLGMPAYCSSQRNRFSHEAGIRGAAGLRGQAAGAALGFEELWLAEDYGQNDSKRGRYQRLRARLRRGARPVPSRGVLLLRGQRGSRRVLVNELDLAERLEGIGFIVLDPERENVETIRDALHDAPMVIGVEGSALVHGLMLMPADGCIVAIQPPRRFNNVQKDRADCIGQRYAFTVADEEEQGFRLPERRLLALIERVERTAG